MIANPLNIGRKIAQSLGARPVSGSALRIVFFHVPKCGGTSIADALDAGIRRRWPLWRAPRVQMLAQASRKAAKHFAEGELAYRERLLMYEMYQPHLASISGHMPCTRNIMSMRRENDIFVSVLRNPRDRVLSEYFYNRFKGGNKSDATTELDLEPWLERETPNRITAYFGQSRQEAIDHLSQMTVLGNTRNLPLFSTEFHDATGIKLKISHAKRSPVAYPKYADQQPHVQKKIDALVVDDMEVFGHFFAP